MWVESHGGGERPVNVLVLHEHLVAELGQVGPYESVLRYVRPLSPLATAPSATPPQPRKHAARRPAACSICLLPRQWLPDPNALANSLLGENQVSRGQEARLYVRQPCRLGSDEPRKAIVSQRLEEERMAPACAVKVDLPRRGSGQGGSLPRVSGPFGVSGGLANPPTEKAVTVL